jgi:hypothetical protein
MRGWRVSLNFPLPYTAQCPSVRVYNRICKVARTVVDLTGAVGFCLDFRLPLLYIRRQTGALVCEVTYQGGRAMQFGQEHLDAGGLDARYFSPAPPIGAFEFE